MTADTDTILAFDVGSKRIGVARASSLTRLPQSLKTLNVDDKIFDSIADLVSEEGASKIVLGLPRNLDGKPTQQTNYVMAFRDKLNKKLDIPVYLTDEAVTSVKAEEELKAHGRPYAKGDIDALAAVYILEDFLHAHQEVS